MKISALIRAVSVGIDAYLSSSSDGYDLIAETDFFRPSPFNEYMVTDIPRERIVPDIEEESQNTDQEQDWED